MFDLVGAKHIEGGFTHRFHHLRSRGNAAKLHLALDGLPTIAGVDKREYGDRFVIAPDEHYVELRVQSRPSTARARRSRSSRLRSRAFRDESLAPTGKHVLSAVVQYAPYALKGGWNDDDAKREFEAATIRVLSRQYMPDIASRITASELLTPADIEEEFHITGGHWHHGELTLDQFLFVRPVAGACAPVPDAGGRSVSCAAPAPIRVAGSAAPQAATRHGRLLPGSVQHERYSRYHRVGSKRRFTHDSLNSTSCTNGTTGRATRRQTRCIAPETRSTLRFAMRPVSST